MGIDVHALNFLRYTTKRRPLGHTITIGRQALNVSEPLVKELVGARPTYRNHRYCEELFIEYFGATKVDSVDNSGFEEATHIHNLNERIPKELWQKFDTIIDGGCSEHVFNAPQALLNYSLFCKPGGQIIHILPANNFCGHGFWQFSPELFFSLYSRTNGYSGTEIFLADLSDTKRWFQVMEPSNGQRVNASSSTALYVLVRTVLQRIDFSHSNVQQSDYVFEWGNARSAEQIPLVSPTGFKKKLKEVPIAYKWLSRANRVYLQFTRPRIETGLNPKNAGLKVVQVKSCV
jgi:hypothetical protein